jgi:MoaD family protein
MGSLVENSWLSITWALPSCIFGHNANNDFSGKTGINREKKYQNPAEFYSRVEGREMQVKVHYISLVKSYTNKSQEEINLPNGSILSELLDQISEIYGKQFQDEVYNPIKKEMKSTYVTMVNGVLMDQLQGIKTPLKNGDNIILMSLMTGG